MTLFKTSGTIPTPGIRPAISNACCVASAHAFHVVGLPPLSLSASNSLRVCHFKGWLGVSLDGMFSAEIGTISWSKVLSSSKLTSWKYSWASDILPVKEPRLFL